MNTKHTPGPFEFDGQYLVIKGKKYELTPVAFADYVTGPKNITPEEATQIGYLLAAAPDLLEALELSIAILAVVCHNNPELISAREALIKGQQAYAKATGLPGQEEGQTNEVH